MTVNERRGVRKTQMEKMFLQPCAFCPKLYFLVWRETTSFQELT